MNDCTFCKLYTRGKDAGTLVYENEHWFARFDAVPVNPGHTEVIPKRHIAGLEEVTAGEWMSLQEAIQETVGAIQDTDLRALYQGYKDNPPIPRSEGFAEDMLAMPYLDDTMVDYNLGLNNGPTAGRTIDHLHFHIIPRFEADMPDQRFGVRWLFPERANYKD